MIRVVLLDDEELVRGGIRMILESGGAIEVVADAGDSDGAADLTKRLLSTFATGSGSKQADARTKLGLLTGREREVALAVATGAGNAEIARSLFMSEATVKVHVSRAIAKLELDNRTQIAILAHQAGEV